MPDRLYRNDGNGRFTNVTEAAGISKADGAGLGVATGDYNGDGWLDLYVANDATPNQLWINQHDGTFVDEGLLSGAALNAAGQSRGQHGHRVGRLRRRRRRGPVRHEHHRRNVRAVRRTTAHGNFDDAADRAGLAAPTAAFTGFGTDWFDYDNDGWLDLFVANGAVNVDRGAARPAAPVPDAEPAVPQHRRAAGSRRQSPPAGPAFARADVGRGAAFGDIDNDGDVDIVVTNNGGPVRLLLNRGRARITGCRSVLDQSPGTASAFGAMVGVERAGRPTLWRRVRTDGSYLSASDSRVHFGLGSSAAVDAVVVQWPDGEIERWPRVDDGSARDAAPRQRRGALTSWQCSPVTKTLTGGKEEGRTGRRLSCHSIGGELLAPRVARLSEHEGRGNEHAGEHGVFVSGPLVLTLAPAYRRAREQRRCRIGGHKDPPVLPPPVVPSGFTSYLRRIQF